MHNKLVIFDCDGVLVDSEIIGARVEAAELTKIGYHLTPEEDITRFTGKTQKDILQIVEQEMGRSLPDGFENMLYQKMMQAMAENLTAIPDVEQVLKVVPHKCLASNAEIPKIDHNLKTTKLDMFFPKEHRFSAEMVPQGKPDPALYLYAAQKMGYAPSSCLVIEDSIVGVTAAKAAGMYVIGFTGAGHIVGQTHADSLRSAGASEIATQMKEVVGLLSKAGAF